MRAKDRSSWIVTRTNEPWGQQLPETDWELSGGLEARWSCSGATHKHVTRSMQGLK